MSSGKFKGKTLRLLEKGHKGLVYALFSRFGLVVLLLLIQVAMMLVLYAVSLVLYDACLFFIISSRSSCHTIMHFQACSPQ